MCRRDYDGAAAWPRMGFTALADRVGRSEAGHLLTHWWLDNGHPDLFGIVQAGQHTAFQAVLDANVFFDFHDNASSSQAESRALLADWLTDEVELLVTPELLNEINRQDDDSARELQRRRASEFKTVRGEPDAFQEAVQRIEAFAPRGERPSDDSDVRHLAHTVAAGVPYFVTRDTFLLDDLGTQIYESFGLEVIRPSDLILDVDELQRGLDYSPEKLSGTSVSLQRIRSRDESRFTTEFLMSSLGERKAAFQDELRRVSADPQRSLVQVFRSRSGDPIALLALERTSDSQASVPLLRIKNQGWGPTLGRQIIQMIIERALEDHLDRIRIDDQFVPSFVKRALTDASFVPDDHCWSRVIHRGCIQASDMPHCIIESLALTDESSAGDDPISDVLSQAAMIERRFWPLKIADASIPTFIVPIKAVWAEELFDEILAAQTLFDRRLELGLNCEHVYYRSSRFAGGLSAPARLLWYVSLERDRLGTGSIRACSRLKHIAVGRPRDLFRKYRRLGVYTWEDILRTSGGDVDGQLMALNFEDTELFRNPVTLPELRTLFGEKNIQSRLQSPEQISPSEFADIYRRGTNEVSG